MIGVTIGCSSNLIEKTSTPYDEVGNYLEENHAEVRIGKDNESKGFILLDRPIALILKMAIH